MGLLLWLSALAYDDRRLRLGRPGKVVLWSPWCDLTMRSPTWKSNGESGPFRARYCRVLVLNSSLPFSSFLQGTSTSSVLGPPEVPETSTLRHSSGTLLVKNSQAYRNRKSLTHTRQGRHHTDSRASNKYNSGWPKSWKKRWHVALQNVSVTSFYRASLN